jgi:anti-anti-sigma regulatory factor
MATPSAVHVAPTDRGCCVRVEGRGTMQESPAVQEFVERTLEAGAAANGGAAPAGAVTVDLSQCEYLDSTFLGCLLRLYQKHNREAARGGSGAVPAGPFAVAAPPERVAKLFGPTRLDRLLRAQPQPPGVVGEWVPLRIDRAALAKSDLTRHVLECHRRLAEVEGPQQAAFRRISEQLEKEMQNAE